MASTNGIDKSEIFKQRAKLLEDNLEYFPDFPKEGILYSEMFKILRTPELFSILRDLLIEKTKEFQPLPDVIIGIDSKGFLFGPLVALELKVPFVPIRKRGKLPGKVKSASYELEYGKDVMEMQEGSIKKGQNAVLVDDCLATGGTLECASELVKAFEGNLIGCLVVTEKYELDGYKKLPCPVKCLMKVK
ncbi:adenine phosphoribosyltransferase-like [Harmonia axyridis]|uniref:adenine phosphoribosyltransferase-like n=1 Tax=Harmonia axyridis TaxID=115357 RepID=UPI001E2776D6|nr:adenine phosphoribosyltransferase-like [Harmonia axyridis]